MDRICSKGTKKASVLFGVGDMGPGLPFGEFQTEDTSKFSHSTGEFVFISSHGCPRAPAATELKSVVDIYKEPAEALIP